MNFSEERWVKLYTRDTTGWRMLTWQARCVLLHAFRKVDRSGAIDLDGDGLDGLAVMLDLPPEVVEAAMSGKQGLLARGAAEVVTLEGRTFFLLPRFIEAQDAKSTPRARKAASRELALAAQSDVTRLDVLGHSVTKRDQESQNVTESHAASHEVTRGHTASRSDQNRSEQIRTENGERDRAPASLKSESESPNSEAPMVTVAQDSIAVASPLAVAGPMTAVPDHAATLAAPRSQKPVTTQPRGTAPDLGLGGPVDLDQAMPSWAKLRYAALEMSAGLRLDVEFQWRRFVSHIAALREDGNVRRLSEPEWQKWLLNAPKFDRDGKDKPAPPPIQYKPSSPPPPAWVSPLHPDRLGAAKRANLLSMLTSTGTGSEEWERVKMPLLSGDEQSAPDPVELDAALCDLAELESIHEGPAIAVKRRIQKYLDRKAGKAGAA